MSTDIRTFRDIPKKINAEILKIKEEIRWLIRQVATDIELSGEDSTGNIIVGPSGIQYKLPENTIQKYRKIMRAKQDNNISVRSVKIAIKFLASINKQLMDVAKKEDNSELKGRLYVTQAVYVYEMADIVLDLLNKIGLEGKPVLEKIKEDSEKQIQGDSSWIQAELKKIKQAEKKGKITEKVAVNLEKTYRHLLEANKSILSAWDSLMEKVDRQENWLNKIRDYRVSVKFKRDAAKKQIETLRRILIFAEVRPLVDSMDDLIAIIQDLEILELTNEDVSTLLFGNPKFEDVKKEDSIPLN